MGVPFHTQTMKESSKDYFHSLQSILEQIESNQLIMEMKAYDALNSTDMLLNIIKESIRSLETLQNREEEKETQTERVEQSLRKTNKMDKNTIGKCQLREIMKTILEAANISNQVSRDIEHEIANQREIIDVMKCKLNL